MTPMSEKRLAEIEAREQAATKGPWSVNEGEHEINEHFSKRWLEIGPHEGDSSDAVAFGGEGDLSEETEATFTFIAHARQDVPDLVKALRHFATLPPEVAAAMRDYASEQDADGIEELAFIIADHFTTLFQKGA